MYEDHDVPSPTWPVLQQQVRYSLSLHNGFHIAVHDSGGYV